MAEKNGAGHHLAGPAGMLHFWSLAVEEQFYVLWPLVVWLFPERRRLIRIVTSLVLLCCAIRLVAPLLAIPAQGVMYFTPTRADAILIGVLIALIRDKGFFARLVPYAKWITLCGGLVMGTLAVYGGQAWAGTYWGVEIWIPVVNLTAAAIVVAVMEEGSLLNKVCSQKWVCWLGSLSYSMYVFHLTYIHFFTDRLVPELSEHMRHSFAVLTAALLAFCLTLALSLLSYRFIEGPVMNLKERLKYSAGVPRRSLTPKRIYSQRRRAAAIGAQ